MSGISSPLCSYLRWVSFPNEWLGTPQNRSVVTEVYCSAISFRAKNNICGANSYVAFILSSISWCAVAKRRGGGFYLSSSKWCGPVVRIISLLAACARAALCPFIANNSSAKSGWNFIALARSRLRTIGAFRHNGSLTLEPKHLAHLRTYSVQYVIIAALF